MAGNKSEEWKQRLKTLVEKQLEDMEFNTADEFSDFISDLYVEIESLANDIRDEECAEVAD